MTFGKTEEACTPEGGGNEEGSLAVYSWLENKKGNVWGKVVNIPACSACYLLAQ